MSYIDFLKSVWTYRFSKGLGIPIVGWLGGFGVGLAILLSNIFWASIISYELAFNPEERFLDPDILKLPFL